MGGRLKEARGGSALHFSYSFRAMQASRRNEYRADFWYLAGCLQTAKSRILSDKSIALPSEQQT